MKVYAVCHKESEWAVPVAAETGRQARNIAWRSDWRGEFTDECLEANTLFCLRVWLRRGLAVDGTPRVLDDKEASDIGFWSDSEE